MLLRPVSKAKKAPYPARAKLPRSGRGWVGRVAVAAASAAILGVSCGGTGPIPSYFVCSEGPPASPSDLEGRGVFHGQLCGAEEAWANLVVSEPHEARFELQSGAEAAQAHVIGPDGYEVASLDAETPLVDLHLSAGRWSLAVSAVDIESNGYASFDLAITEAPDP